MGKIFFLPFENNRVRTVQIKYFLSNVEIKDQNIMIIGIFLQSASKNVANKI